MKKIGNFLIISVFVIVMCVSILFLDSYSVVLTIESHYSDTSYQLKFDISNNDYLNPQEKIDLLLDLAKKYNFNLYALDMLSENEANLYLSTKDVQYIHLLPISNKEQIYNTHSSFNKGQDTKIDRLSFFSSDRVTFYQFSELKSLTSSAITLGLVRMLQQ